MFRNIDNQTIGGEGTSKPEVIKLGLDLHAGQVTECRQLDCSTPKPARQWDPWKLLYKVEEWAKAGSKVYSCCEAGPCGYHRELTKCGAVNYVVARRPLHDPVRRVLRLGAGAGARPGRPVGTGMLSVLFFPTFAGVLLSEIARTAPVTLI